MNDHCWSYIINKRLKYETSYIPLLSAVGLNTETFIELSFDFNFYSIYTRVYRVYVYIIAIANKFDCQWTNRWQRWQRSHFFFVVWASHRSNDLVIWPDQIYTSYSQSTWLILAISSSNKRIIYIYIYVRVCLCSLIYWLVSMTIKFWCPAKLRPLGVLTVCPNRHYWCPAWNHHHAFAITLSLSVTCSFVAYANHRCHVKSNWINENASGDLPIGDSVISINNKHCIIKSKTLNSHSHTGPPPRRENVIL